MPNGLVAKQQVVNIGRVCAPTVDQFLRDYFEKDVPVIITDVANHWPAANWTLESIKERAGHNKAFVRQNTSKDDYKIGKAYNIRESTLGEYINDLDEDNKRAKNSYLAVQNIKSTFPELEADVPMPDYVGKIHMGPYLWIATKGHYEYCHFDPDDGLLVLLNGRKKIRLYGCSVELLYPNPPGSKGRTIQAQVNCDDPDLDKHPMFPAATCFQGELGPGEMLYIPSFWWHQVTSTETSISVNFFFGDAGENNFISKAIHLKWSAFSHWLLNIIEQNRHYESFQQVLAYLPGSLAAFFLKEWKERISREQAQTLVNLIMDYLGLKELPFTDGDRTSKNPPPLKIRGLLWRK